MATTRYFPIELLTQSPKVKLTYFENYIIQHPYLDEAAGKLKLFIKTPGESRVIFIYGPAGVGKTTLRSLIEKWIIENSLSKLETDRGRIPVASVEVALHKGTNFNPKDHIKRCLFALHEPEEFIDYKIDYGVKGIYRNNQGQIVVESNVLETNLGWALEQALKHRRPYIFFIDEFHHMLKVASGRKLSDLPEAIKSLANRTEVVHGLLGTYEMLTLHDIGDQLSRRSVYVHIPRYRADWTEDRLNFQSIVWSFQLHMPLEEEPDLLSYWEYLYERSLGCVGTLKNWLNTSVGDALEEGAKTLTLKHLERRALSVAQCRNMLKTIKEGEHNHAQIEAEVGQLRADLGLEVEPCPKPITTGKLSPDNQPYRQTQNSIMPQSKGRTKRDVGKRSPKRDKVGGIEQDAG